MPLSMLAPRFSPFDVSSGLPVMAAWKTSHPDGKLDLNRQLYFPHHRSGWSRVLASLEPLHNGDGVFLDAYVEERFGWNLREALRHGEVPYTRPWVGMLHNPPEMPAFYRRATSPAALLDSWAFRESLPWCRGLFVFSEYARRWLAPRVDVPVCALVHPTDPAPLRFSMERFERNPEPKILQIGSWLRRTLSIRHLPSFDYEKVWILPNEQAHELRRLEEYDTGGVGAFGLPTVGRYREMERVDPARYDRLLSENLVFLDLYDASANNTVLECIVRATPLLVNRLPAVAEYLGGEEYPLFYDDLGHAARLAADPGRVAEAHAWLAGLDLSRFGMDAFVGSVRDSGIDRRLPAPGAPVRESRRVAAPVDRLEDLDVVEGAPLDTQFVFVVAFRNQAGRIARCLESLYPHHEVWDFGVAVIDDASDDDGLDAALAVLREGGKPYVAVRNAERRFYTRNLYNAVQHLCLRDDAVVLEVDGDDFLEDRDVLGVVDRAYRDGALKTFGRFRCGLGEDVYPGMDFLRRTDLAECVDWSTPWDLDRCFSWMHLKTFQRKLFTAIPLVYFLERNGRRWLRSGEDLILHPKMCELASDRVRYIDEVLYVYDFTGSDHDILWAEQARYLLDNLYRLPMGSHVGYLRECVQEGELRRSLGLPAAGADAPRAADADAEAESGANRDAAARESRRIIGKAPG